MNDDDREELIYRRIADKVTESVDRQIKRRYFLAALLLAAVSWFGGTTLFQGIVQSQVAREMEPARRAATQAQLQSEQLSTEFQKTVDELRKKGDEIRKAFDEAQTKITKLNDSLKETDQKLGDTESRFEKQLAGIQSDAGLAVSQINERMKALGQLNIGQVVVRTSPDVPAELIAQLGAKIRSTGKYAVTIEGGRAFIASSSLRYYYKDDAASAEEIASIATDALKEFGISNGALPTIPLTGMAIKPPERTMEMWLNVSDGKLL